MSNEQELAQPLNGGTPPTALQTLRVSLPLRIEGQSKSVRTKGQVRSMVELLLLQPYNMQKETRFKEYYELKISYQTDQELNTKIRTILQEETRIPDDHDCFIEAEAAALDGSELYWC